MSLLCLGVADEDSFDTFRIQFLSFSCWNVDKSDGAKDA